jgi:hypothetical protein
MLKRAGSGILLAGGLLLVVITPAMANECSQAAQSSGQCLNITTELDQEGITLGASTSSPGAPGQSSASSSGSAQSWWSPPPPREPVLGTSECEIKVSGYCRASSPDKNPTVSSGETAPEPPSHASDLESFVPGAPGIEVEPNGWSLPRLPTNIFARINESVKQGELLGWPIQVRFSPSTYRFSYGDGTSSQLSVAGSSWGSGQFLPTATSHVYSYPGTYQVGLQVGFDVAYRFDGGPFVPVSGTVWRDAGTRKMEVLRVTPLLVEEGCAAHALVGGRCSESLQVFLGFF